MRTSFVVPVLVLIAWVTGCATAAPHDPDSSSTALQVVRAAGFKHIRDVTRADVQAANIKTSSGDSPLGLATLGAGTALGVFKPYPGLSRGGGVALTSVAALLFSGPAIYPESSSRALVWMPKGMAATPEEAARLLRTVLVDALAASLPAGHVELKERVVEKSTMSRQYVAVDRGTGQEVPMFGPMFVDGRLPRIETAPAILGGKEAYVWGGPGVSGDGQFVGFPWTDSSLAPAERQAILQRFSANLPPWVRLYVPPDERLAPYPQVLNQGEVQLFIKPDLVNQTTAALQTVVP